MVVKIYTRCSRTNLSGHFTRPAGIPFIPVAVLALLRGRALYTDPHHFPTVLFPLLLRLVVWVAVYSCDRFVMRETGEVLHEVLEVCRDISYQLVAKLMSNSGFQSNTIQ